MAGAVHIKGYGNGGPGRCETFRVSWWVSGDPGTVDFRSAVMRAEVAAGRAGVGYYQGAGARDLAVADAETALERAGISYDHLICRTWREL